MNLELPNPKYVPWLILGLMVIMVMGYLLYLAATWNQYQMDRLSREEKVNELLSRFPRRDNDRRTDNAT